MFQFAIFRDQALRSLMTQMEQVVDVHMGEAIFDRKKPEALKPEALKVETIRANGDSTVLAESFFRRNLGLLLLRIP